MNPKTAGKGPRPPSDGPAPKRSVTGSHNGPGETGTQASDTCPTCPEPSAPPRPLDLTAFKQGLDCHYHLHRQEHYALYNGDGTYLERSLGALKRDLIEIYQIRKARVDEVISYIDHHKGVDFIGELAGWRAGLQTFNQLKMLITKGPRIIEAKSGQAATINAMLEALLDEAQRHYVYGWLSTIRASLKADGRRPMPVLVLCGPQGCGKSIVQNQLFTPILGGRAADPFAYVTKQTRFNRELMAAEHWPIDDKEPLEDPRARETLAAYMRRSASSPHWAVEHKGVDATTLPACPHMSISCNDDDDSIEVLPSVTALLENKVILLHTRANDFPWPKNDAQYKALCAHIGAELSAFAHFLDHYQIPEELRDNRYGIKAWQAPELTETLRKIGPEFEALRLCVQMIDHSATTSFEGRAGEWYKEIHECCDGLLRDHLRRLAPYPNTLGKLLSKLVNAKAKGVYSRNHGNQIYYGIDTTVVDL